MRKIFTHLTGAMLLLLLTVSVSLAQNITVSGTVTDKSNNETLPGVSVTVKGKTAGTSTNGQGKFTLTVTEKAPFTLVISYIGYKTIESTVNGSDNNLNFQLDAQAVLGQEVVVAASRTPEKILESPVSIERVSAAAIREGANNSFYDALANLKGVESSSQSFTFRSINTRGFNSNGNTRVNQFTDGMDNQAPGLNFSVGNIIGLSELDVESVELLPGASSALYGSGGMNGTILMNSKSPFTYPGLSFQLRTGGNHYDNPLRNSTAPLHDYSFRYAVKSNNNRVAFKTTFSYLSASDWQAGDYSNFSRVTQQAKAGDRSTDSGYDGVNVYGDEVSTKFGATGGLLNGQTVSRTGYEEKYLVDYGAKSVRTLNSLHYKITPTIEAIVQGSWGAGTTVYTGSERYSIKNFKLSQYKAEIKGENFYVRAYTTREDSGDSYNATALASYLNEYSKPSATYTGGVLTGGWFVDYATYYNGARLGSAAVLTPFGLSGAQNDATSHKVARQLADATRFKPGTALFENAKDLITSRVIGAPTGGAKFADKSFVNQYEGMYNLSSALKNVIELQIGGMYRQYSLNSNGTIFDDLNKDLTIDEVGAFIQASKKLMNDKLKLIGSSRYDKSQNFKGQFTPRLAAVYSVAPNNNIRVSYQTGFRIPTTQNQYISLNTGSTTLLGGIASILDAKGLRSGIGQGYTRESVAAGTPVKYNFASELKPERSQSFELGYKGLVTKNILIDAYGYHTTFKDYIASLALLRNEDANGVPTGGVPTASSKSYGTVVNDPNKVKSYGFGLGVDYLWNDFRFSFNGSTDRLIETQTALESEFNTPEFRFNMGVANQNLYKNIGASINYRWQDAFRWSSTFIAGNVDAFGTVDAQINFRFPENKYSLKFGGSNILNKYYRTNYGNPTVGAVYYVTLTFDQLMK